ncbi:MAG: adenosine deaminase [Acidimicrobiia bacterium]
MRSFIEAIPKAELHLHLEGTLEPELKFLLAERNKLELPYSSVEEMRTAYDFDDLPSFLAMYYEGMSVLVDEEDFFDLAYAYFLKAHSQNVVYAEVFFDPQAHTSRGVAFDTVIRGIRRAQVQASESLGLHSQLIMCFLRDMSAESAMAALETADEYRDWLIGVGLDSDEKDNPPNKFAAVFAAARERGYRVTAHCDVDQEDTIANLWQCLNEIGVDRIDHGVNSLEDPELVAEVRSRGLGLTVCPISNSYVTDGFKAAEIRHMLELGLRVCINSDDPAYFPGYMTENLMAVQQAAELSQSHVVQLIRNAFEISWLEEKKRNQYLHGLDDYVAAQSA